MNKLRFLTLSLIMMCPSISFSNENLSLEALLEGIKTGRQHDITSDKKRLNAFQSEKINQAKAYTTINTSLIEEEDNAKRLEQTFEKNDNVIKDLETALITRMGTLKELLGTVQQTALAAQGEFENSLTQIEFPERAKLLEDLRKKIGSSNKLLSVTDLEDLWFELQREMTESSKIKTFETNVFNENGMTENLSVTRIGLFNLISEAGYLVFNSATGKARVLKKQPHNRHLNYSEKFLTQKSGYATLSIDPSRGQILALLTKVPSLSERIAQGGFIGYIIIFLGVIGVIIALERFVSLAKIKKDIKAQISEPHAIQKNPMGRILTVYNNCRTENLETVELKLTETLLHEAPLVKRRLIFLKTIAVVAPLLGLLGTVTGMILTFQAITLFGTGDPKLMAGGISQALVTTALGLTTAIPILILHTLIGTRATNINQTLEEEVTGLIARHPLPKNTKIT